jgi:hypothetical protein
LLLLSRTADVSRCSSEFWSIGSDAGMQFEQLI